MTIVPVFSREYKIWIWKDLKNYYGIERGVKRHHASGLLKALIELVRTK